jgi:hypothetical protein
MRLFAFTALFLGSWLQQSSNSSQPAATALSTTSITGRVLLVGRSSPQTPLRHAVVVLESGTRVQAVSSDSDGLFSFAGLPPGRYVLRVNHAGFIQVPGPTAVDVSQPGALARDLSVEPAAVLAGTVIGKDGSPLSGVTVYARLIAGAATATVVSTTRTNDVGHYRLHTLRAGAYQIQVDLVGPQTQADRGEPAPGGNSTYYPGAASTETATTVTLASGQSIEGLDVNVSWSPTPVVGADVVQLRPSPTSASVAGRLSQLADGHPIPGAVVTLSAVESSGQYRTASDSVGRFSFSDVAPGQYRLAASSEGFTPEEFGQRRPLERGKVFVLRQKDVFDKANFSLGRGGVIEGMVIDESGMAVPGVSLQVARVEFIAGRRRLNPVSSVFPPAPTDDQGSFRIAGLSAGDYLVVALPGAFGQPDLNQMRGAADPSASFRNLMATARTSFPPTYFPGTPRVSDAQYVHVTAESGAPRVTIQMTPQPSGSVSGLVTDSSGQPKGRLMVIMAQLQGGDVITAVAAPTTSAADGSFEFYDVPPGQYVIQALSPFRVQPSFFGSVLATVSEKEPSRPRVTVQPGASVRGKVVFDDGSSTPTDGQVSILARVADYLSGPLTGRGQGQARVREDGTFELQGTTGRCFVRTTAPAPWVLESVLLAGGDVTDSAFDCGGSARELEIHLTRETGVVRGSVADDRGPVTDYDVVLFSEDSTKWQYPSRFVDVLRPDQNGGFRSPPLIPGRYLIVALVDLAADEWQDPKFLEQLKPKSSSVTVGTGESNIVLKILK